MASGALRRGDPSPPLAVAARLTAPCRWCWCRIPRRPTAVPATSPPSTGSARRSAAEAIPIALPCTSRSATWRPSARPPSTTWRRMSGAAGTSARYAEGVEALGDRLVTLRRRGGRPLVDLAAAPRPARTRRLLLACWRAGTACCWRRARSTAHASCRRSTRRRSSPRTPMCCRPSSSMASWPAPGCRAPAATVRRTSSSARSAGCGRPRGAGGGGASAPAGSSHKGAFSRYPGTD